MYIRTSFYYNLYNKLHFYIIHKISIKLYVLQADYINNINNIFLSYKIYLKVETTMNFQPVPCKPGDIVLFSGYCTHRLLCDNFNIIYIYNILYIYIYINIYVLCHV